MSEIISIQDKSLKTNFDSLVKDTPPVENHDKESIDQKIDELIKAFRDRGKDGPFENEKHKIDELTKLIKKIANCEYSKAETEKLKQVFKKHFKLTIKLFDGFYQEERTEVIRKKRKQLQKKEIQEKITKLENTKTGLLDIHTLLSGVSSAAHDIIEIVMAVAISLKMSLKDDTALLWVMLVGPPSSDKTGTITTLLDDPDVYYLDTLTENAFISGYVPDNKQPTQDLLAELDKKCFIVKDFTTLFSLKADTIKKILGDMCAIYDKRFSKYTGTRGKIEYEASFSHLGCITPVALSGHQIYMNIIGPRFLFYRILPLTNKQLESGYEIAWSGADRKGNIKTLREHVSAYVWQLRNSEFTIKPETREQKEIINNLAEFLRHGRAVLKSTRQSFKNEEGKTINYYEVSEVQTEEPWRALQQLQALIRCLAVVHKRDFITKHEIELARRVVMSSMPVDRAEILCLFQHPEVVKNNHSLTRKQCSNLTGKSYNQANRILSELEKIGLIEETPDFNSDNSTKTYCPKDEFRDLIVKPIDLIDHIEEIRGVTQNFS